jgi:hypothetical protein
MTKRARVSSLLLSTVMAATFGSGCAAQEAPEGLDNLARFIFERVEPAEGLELGVQETELRDAVIKLEDELQAQNVTIDTPFTATLKDLDVELVADLEGVGDRADDVGLAQGFALANLTNCSLQNEINLVMSNRAMEIHPDVYESYGKDFDGEPASFRDGDVDFLTWETTYKIVQPPVGSAYEASLGAAGRRVKGADGSGDIFMTRVHLLEPAKFDGEGSSFDLDFQMEIYYERDGELGHLYTMWRRMVLGPVDSSSELFISQTLSGFVDFEKRVDDACVAGVLDD